MANKVDKYKMIAVVDAGRSFANNEVSCSFELGELTALTFL